MAGVDNYLLNVFITDVEGQEIKELSWHAPDCLQSQLNDSVKVEFRQVGPSVYMSIAVVNNSKNTHTNIHIRVRTPAHTHTILNILLSVL